MPGEVTETHKSPWGMSSLWDSRAASKCTVAILDTVFLTSEGPSWLFTNRNGEVSKKRSVTGDAISSCFVRLAEHEADANPQNRMAFLRYSDGSSKIVDKETLNSMLQRWPPSEPNLAAIQNYVPSAGSAGTVYRNSMRVVNDKGRVTTMTQSYTTVPREQVDSANVQCPEAVLARSKATSLNQLLDSATRTVVRFLEGVHKCRVLNMSVDYIVDSKNQLWLAWVGDATVATGEAVLDLTAAGLAPERGVGTRDSWIDNHARSALESRDKEAERPKRTLDSPTRRERPKPAKDIVSKHVADAADIVEAASMREQHEHISGTAQGE